MTLDEALLCLLVFAPRELARVRSGREHGDHLRQELDRHRDK